MRESDDLTFVKLFLIGFWLLFISFIVFSFIIVAKAESFSYQSVVGGYTIGSNSTTLHYDLILVPSNQISINTGDTGVVSSLVGISNSSNSYNFVSGHSYAITFDFELMSFAYSSLISGNGTTGSTDIINGNRNFYFAVGNSGSWTNATFDSVISCSDNANSNFNRHRISCDYTLDVTHNFDSFKWEFFSSHTSYSSSSSSHLGSITGVNSVIVGIYDLSSGEVVPDNPSSSGDVDLSYIESSLDDITESLSGIGTIVPQYNDSTTTQINAYNSKLGQLNSFDPSASDWNTIFSYDFNHDASSWIWALFTRFVSVSPYLLSILFVILTLGIIKQIFNR